MAKYQFVSVTAEHDGEGWSSSVEGRYDVFYEISDTETEEEIIHRLCNEEKEWPSSRYYLDGSRYRASFLKPESETEVYITNGCTDFFIEIALKENDMPIAWLELVED